MVAIGFKNIDARKLDNSRSEKLLAGMPGVRD